MDKRIRSPNYPAIGLREALAKTEALYKAQHTHVAPREVAVLGMGYRSLNGASATAISALQKYGLLERSGEGVRVSDRALRIMHPHSPDERLEAIRQAATEPALFNELNEKFPPPLPSEELLRNYLIRAGFAPAAVSQVILAYRETMELVEHESGGYGGGTTRPEARPMQHAEIQPSNVVFATRNIPIGQGDSRSLARYDFEGGGFIQVLVGGNVPTEAALNMAETLIKLKRAEIAARNAESAQAASRDEKKEDEDDTSA